jgi:hypothetical protein
MHDVAGKQVYKKEFDNVDGVVKYEQDLSSFPSGTYYISLKGANEVKVEKIVKY